MGSINTETWTQFLLLKDEETQANQSYDKAVVDFRKGLISEGEFTQAWLRKQQVYESFKAFRDNLFSSQ